MLRCQEHYNAALDESDESGCDVVGGPAQSARYECPEDRPDLWRAHQDQHGAIRANAAIARQKAKLEAERKKAAEAAGQVSA